MLAVMIRYFSKPKEKIITTLYMIICLPTSDTETITSCLLSCLGQDKIEISRLIGIGTDNASVMIGANSLVYTKLGEWQPTLLLVRCVCHSLALAASHAVECLTRNLDFMIEHMYSWFLRSAKRQGEFAEIYKVINDNRSPLKILRFVQTRWLSLYQCLWRILDQWDALKLYFSAAARQERSFDLDQLSRMYSDKINRLYLLFLASILQLVMDVNIKFQAENANPLKLIDHVVNLYEKLLQKIVKPTEFRRMKAADLTNFNFERCLRDPATLDIPWEMNNEFGQVRFSGEDCHAILRRCQEFVIELAKEVRDRLLESLDILDTAMTSEPNFVRPLLYHFSNIDVDKQKAASEYGLLHKGSWDCETFSDVEAFWRDVLTKEGGEEGRFQNISKFTFALLSLPFSNASVEQFFL